MKELIFILFFFSGLIKSVLNYYNINSYIDITFLSSLFVILYLIYDISINHFKFNIHKNKIISIASLLFFYFLMIISISYSESPNYKYEKTLLFSLNIIAFLYPILIKAFNTKRFLKQNIIITILLSFWYIWISGNVKSIDYQSIQYHIYASFYLASSLMLGLNLIILTTSQQLIFSTKKQQTIISFIIFITMLLTRGRGPLIFSFFIIVIFYLYQFLKQKQLLLRVVSLINNIKLFFLSGIIFLFIYIPNYSTFNKMISTTVTRLLLLIPHPFSNTIIEHGDSVDTRVSQIKESFNLIFDNIYNFIFGYGIGSYGFITKGIDVRLYPHNIFIEIMVEMGIIGLLSFILFAITTQYSSINKNKFISSFVIFYLLLNMLKSSSITDIRIYFAIFAIYIVSSIKKSNSYEN